jgi:DUF177 domain-containing protein
MVFDLGRLSLASGEGRRLQFDVPFDDLELAGQDYRVTAAPVTLDVSRTTTGWSLRLRYEATLAGPCMRCLEPARRTIAVDVREVDQPGGGDELRSPYVEGDELDVQAWARDALALDLAGQVVCREDCAGLCAVCGKDLNEEPHEHERAPDPRWAKLSELRHK